MSELPQRRMTDEQIAARYEAQQTAIRRIEQRVDQLDQWADENAAKKDYSGAGSQQKSAVDLHCAVALIKEALFPHDHNHPGFSWAHGDTCPGCELEDYLKRSTSTRGKAE